MRGYLRLLRGLYRSFLNLFPKKYREEYGEELQAVFGLSLDDAVKKGSFEAERLVLRELLSLPKAVVLEHLRARRNAKMIPSFVAGFDFAHGSWKEFLTALLPFFLLGGALPLLSYLRTSNQLATEIMLGLIGLLIILLTVGLRMGMPRWSLPYLGFISSVLSVYVFSFLLGAPIYFLFRNFRGSSLLMDIMWDGIFWYGLLIAIALLAAKSRTSSALRHLRNDWTLLCFVLYGAAPFALWLTFDEYVGDEPYMFMSFLVLASGAWFYLRSKGEWKRFGVLIGALAFAVSIAAAGKAILVPSQNWPITIDPGLSRSEAKHTIIMGMWLGLSMLIPVGIKLFPAEVSEHNQA